MAKHWKTLGIVLFTTMSTILVSTAAAASVKFPEEFDGKELQETVISEDLLEKLSDAVKAGDSTPANEEVGSNGLSIPKTTDLVSINDDTTITVLTDEGLEISVLPPFGTLVFSQDVLASWDSYMMYDDPLPIVENMAEINSHILIFDTITFSQTNIITCSDIVGTVVSDIDSISESDALMVADVLDKNSGPETVSCRTIGDHRFFLFDYGNLRIYESVKNGICIDFSIAADELSEYDINSLELMLEEANITTV